jgi:cytochrome c-type biogenesis protein CcmE
MGFVKEGSVAARSGELVTDFVIRDETGDRSLPVRYRGVLPDMFREGSNVIAGGRLGEDGVFTANDVMTKCPSKYEGVETPHAMPDGAPMPAGTSVPEASTGAGVPTKS